MNAFNVTIDVPVSDSVLDLEVPGFSSYTSSLTPFLPFLNFLVVSLYIPYIFFQCFIFSIQNESS